MEGRRLISAIVAALAVFFLYNLIWSQFRPKRPPQPPASQTTPSSQQPAATPGQPSTTPETTTPTTTLATRPALRFTQGTSTEPVMLGGGISDKLRLELNPRGAAVASLWLSARKSQEPDGKYLYRAEPRENEPYALLSPVREPGILHYSYVTRRIIIKERGDESHRLDDLLWERVDAEGAGDGERIAFQTTLAGDDAGQPLMRLTKTYELIDGKPLVNMSLAVENLGSSPLTVTFEQDGPIGIPREQMQYDMRRVMAAFHDGGVVELSGAKNRQAIHKAVSNSGQPFIFAAEAQQTYAWTALTNRFFAVFTRPIGTQADAPPASIFSIGATIAAPGIPDDKNPGDMRARITTTPMTVAAGALGTQTFEIYAGPKDPDTLTLANPAFVDPAKVGYHLAQFADRTCMCTFGWLTQLMAWLLHGIQRIVINYGVAIIIVVMIIRTVLHPLTVFQQKSMIKTQEGMARVQPKMDAIKEKYANDKQKQNQEMMKLFSEEGVNPAASMVSMVPMLIQMPILVAMWMSLNSDVELRHQPFMLWIHDLSAPDALITFGGNGFTIPILGQLISWFRDIPTLNVLPILMGVSMYMQQKYMPKPAQTARREAAREKAAAAGTESKMEMQLKQQHMMAVMMSFLFPLMFYYMPSGLNLYWMSTNVFGIFETLIVRRQLAREKERREKGAPPEPKGPRKPGPIGRFLKHLAEQAEELQRKADEMSQQQPPRKKSRDADDKKKSK